MGMQGQRAGLGSRTLSWGQLFVFICVLLSTTVGPLIVLAILLELLIYKSC
jgi:hypothetical protein